MTASPDRSPAVDLGFQNAPRHLVCEYFAIQDRMQANHRRWRRLMRYVERAKDGIGNRAWFKNAHNLRRFKIYDRRSGRLYHRYGQVFQRIVAIGEALRAAGRQG